MAASSQSPRLGDWLLNEGHVSQTQLDLALREQKRKGGLLGEVLIELGFVEEQLLASFLASKTKGDQITLGIRTIPPEVIRLVPQTLARRFTAIPIELQTRQYGIRVGLIPDVELQRTASFVLAVGAQMPADALRVRFPTQVKIGPVERIRDLVNLQLPGVTLRALPVAPRQIPYHAGFTYFELETRGSDLWRQLETSGGLALHVAGDFPGLALEFWAIRG